MQFRIPNHLKKYTVQQDYNQYTYIDQACWRFIMKISINFFQNHADKTYIEGLKKTGITIDKIPKIQSINKKLLKFGWRAVCVRGFIPPQIFMEFQSLKILPIAADMRNHHHLTYTPSPDIVHEAAGHAPIIANKDYSEYLINYGEIASKAILSSEDMDLYYAIRDLSDIKENIQSTRKQIKDSEHRLKTAYNKISYSSEAAYLSRMNWWTVEYGLIGDIYNPRIFGAGLLSSVAESENCLTSTVKKIPFSLKCLKYNYDITEQQPQLFVTPSYKFLSKELKKLSKTMSYKKGGKYGLDTAIKAKTVCTIEFENSIQISGIVSNYIINKKNNTINFIKLEGPSQISLNNKQIKNHGPSYHASGYSTPIGNIYKYKKPIDRLNKNQIKKLNIIKNQLCTLEFENNIIVKGFVHNFIKKNSKISIITFKDCLVKHGNKVLFDPTWGYFDLVCASKVKSVYNGPADTVHYYIDLENKKTRYTKYNTKQKLPEEIKKIDYYFKKIEDFKKIKNNIVGLSLLYKKMVKNNINDWLLKYEFLCATDCNRNLEWVDNMYIDLEKEASKKSDLSRAIKRGLNLFV